MSAAEIFRLLGQSRTRNVDALAQTAMQSTFRTGPAIGGAALTANIGSEKPQSLQRPVEDSPYVEV